MMPRLRVETPISSEDVQFKRPKQLDIRKWISFRVRDKPSKYGFFASELRISASNR
jgi:hypothetical protein